MIPWTENCKTLFERWYNIPLPLNHILEAWAFICFTLDLVLQECTEHNKHLYLICCNHKKEQFLKCSLPQQQQGTSHTTDWLSLCHVTNTLVIGVNNPQKTLTLEFTHFAFILCRHGWGFYFTNYLEEI